MAEARPTVLAGRETAHRFAQRVKAERRRKRRRWFAAVCVVAVLAGSVALVARSSLLRVDRVVVTGTRRQPVAEVLDAAGVRRADPMWALDTVAVRRRVVALPRVKAAAVDRSWPRTVRITVIERQPVATVAPPTGGYLVVDSSGSEIERVPAAPAGLLALQLTAPTLADTPEARRPLVDTALTIAVSLTPPVRARVGLIRVASTENVELVLTDGALVRWGSADRSQRKAVVLTALLKTAYRTYDVRAPESPAVQ